MIKFLAYFAIVLAILSVAVSAPLATALTAAALILLAGALIWPATGHRRN